MTAPGHAEFDVAIVGGGMVGASLALALEPLELKVALIEPYAPDAAAQPSFDERTTALSNGSRRIFEALGVWPDLAAVASPIRKIHVSDQGRFGFARIDATEQGLESLGYVIANRAIGAALYNHLNRSSTVSLICPAEVREIHADANGVTLLAAHGTLPATTLRSRLVVAADGMHSAVRAALAVGTQVRQYEQTAVITTILPQRFHAHVAYERFTPEGPLALLPLNDGRCTLVLAVRSAVAPEILSWQDAQFLAEVQRRFGFRLGRFLQVGRRSLYPLSLSLAAEVTAPRCVIIGNAAQGLHPVAGMGFNLGLRDVATLAECLAQARTDAARPDAPRFDAGDAAVLARYADWRKADRRAVTRFTDGLVRLFSSRSASVALLRNVGLLAFDALPPLKAALAQLGSGTGRIPKLARGVPLR